ncbi:stalk domain-containing protein [Gorillibacterium sp. CAU 1737]|uniref:alpha/beta hydrolase family protein n=1 Tax=Gorillibacterium sp. CAU 1737 TaxID=3140362 RepID=UPI00326034CC
MTNHEERAGRASSKPKRVLVLTLAAALLVPAGNTLLPATVQAESAVPSAGSAAPAEESSSWVPLRVIAEALGARVDWEGASRKVTVSRGKSVTSVWIDKDQAFLNGKESSLPGKVRLENGATLVPLGFLREALGVNFGWKGNVVIPEAQDLEAKAALFVNELMHGRKDHLTAASTPALNQALTPMYAATWSAQLLPLLGEKTLLSSWETQENSVHTNLILRYQTDQVPYPIEAIIRFSKAGLVDDFSFSQETAPSAHKPASYDQSDSYTEREVVIGEGSLALPGTLTVPKGDGPFPAVVLVHGSGPNNRDEEVGGAKVFKDLAGGLASRGIAVLRYEKVTREHPFKAGAQEKFSLWEETGADALQAASFLRGQKEVDANRIFLTGHSQGGYAAPLILERDEQKLFKGAVLLSAPSGNLMDVVVEQQEEALRRLTETGQPESLLQQQEQAVAAYKAIREQFKNPAYSKDQLPEQFPLGSPYWWFEQRDYMPAQKAKAQSVQMLILAGENDWQVTLAQYEGWKEALKNRTNVEYRSYANVNHLLAVYDKLSTGLEYGQSSNVSADIVRDVAEWVKTH